MTSKTKSNLTCKITEKLEDLIRARRRAVVTATLSPGYSYSIGLADRYLPEMLVFGVGADESPKTIVRAALAAPDGASLATDEPHVGLFEGFQAVLRQLTQKEVAQYPTAAWVRSTGKLEAVQIFWPDPMGNFPREGGFDQKLATYQPLLGLQPLLRSASKAGQPGPPAGRAI